MLRQTLTNWELIIIDDGSTDETADYLSGINDPRIRPMRVKHTANIALLRNIGAQAANGRYLAFLDSDDVWLPGKLAAQANSLQESGISWCYTRYEHCSADGSRISWREGHWIERSGCIARDVLLGHASVSIITVMVKTEAFRILGGFDESLSAYEDIHFIARLAAMHRTVAIPEIFALCREHGGRTTRITNERKLKSGIAAHSDLMKYAGDKASRRAVLRKRSWFAVEAGRLAARENRYFAAARHFLRALLDSGRAGRLLAVLAKRLFRQ